MSDLVKVGEKVRFPTPHVTAGHEPAQQIGIVEKVFDDGGIKIKDNPSIWPPTRFTRLG